MKMPTSEAWCRVLRGGGWFSPASYLRASDRCGYVPSYRISDLGFRLVRREG